jgi:hypothetical protein
MAKKRAATTFDAIGKRLLELGFSYSYKRVLGGSYHAYAFQFPCFRNPVNVYLEGGRSGVHPAQLEAVELLLGARGYVLNDDAIRITYGGFVEWCRMHNNAPDGWRPSMRWAKEHFGVGTVHISAPHPKARGTIAPQIELEVYRFEYDDHPTDLSFIWTGRGWMGTVVS